MISSVLVVDDEMSVLRALRNILEKGGYNAEISQNIDEAMNQIKSRDFDLVLCDINLNNGSGIDLLKWAKSNYPDIPFIMITGYGSIDSAIEAIKNGAIDYLQKPIVKETILLSVEKGIRHSNLIKEVKRIKGEYEQRDNFMGIYGRSKLMRNVFRLVEKVAPSQATVLIIGESGTGKELIARALHLLSNRKDRQFIPVDCSSLPETLLESELFGHVRGSFTGAYESKKGLFVEADGGTLFLDEVADISLAVQSKLLRVLQEREVKPVGSNEVIPVDVRVIAATNKDLKEEVKKGTFREDLYYRLAVIPIFVPPLRERKEDIPLLIHHFLNRYCKKNNLELKQLSPEALGLLLDYKWYGNVRELENVIERSVLISEGNIIRAEDLPVDVQGLTTVSIISENSLRPIREAKGEVVRIMEKELIEKALGEVRGNRTKAARILGISRGGLYLKLRQYGIEKKEYKH